MYGFWYNMFQRFVYQIIASKTEIDLTSSLTENTFSMLVSNDLRSKFLYIPLKHLMTPWSNGCVTLVVFAGNHARRTFDFRVT